MEQPCDYRLTSIEPIVAGWMRLEYYADGWSLVVGHRHYAGHAGDCPCSTYERLTGEELRDVLEATVANWGPPSTWPIASGAAEWRSDCPP